MGHTIQGFVGRETELREFFSVYPSVRLISLKQGFAFAPLTRTVCAEIAAGGDFLADICDERFIYLSSQIFQFGRRLSLVTPVALIETEYFGGEGFQRAVAWRDGDVRFGPAVAGNEEGVQIDRQTSHPINRALQEIDVRGYLMENEDEDPKDEFDELGLGRYRSNDDWLAAAG